LVSYKKQPTNLSNIDLVTKLSYVVLSD